MRNDIVVKVMVLVVLGCVGCGDKSPSEKCEDLIDSICDRAVECITGADGMHRQCVDAVKQQLSCGAVKSVKPSYDRCIDLLNGQSCNTLFPPDPTTGSQMLKLPVECNGVLSTQSAYGEVDSVQRAAAPSADPIDDVAVRAQAVLESPYE